MRTLQAWFLSLATLPFIAALVASGRTPDTASVNLASAGGSELPWWTPLGVTLGLLAVAGLYKLRHRMPRTPGDAGPPLADDAEAPPVPEAHPADATDPEDSLLDAGDLGWHPARS
jgi:hypothetical protein